MTLDRLGQRYGCLPSEVLREGNTFDLQVLDIAMSYENYLRDKQNGLVPNVSTDVMEQALKQVKKNDNKSKD